MRRVLLLAITLGVSGCFPDYSVENDGEPLVPPGMNRIYSNGQTFEFQINELGNAAIPASVEFDYDFDMDQHEVTVGRFLDWKNAAIPFQLPCNGASCPLDPQGPYEDEMVWFPQWNTVAQDATNFSLPKCEGVPEGDYGSTTYDLGNVEYPMTCATWIQAVAFCAFEGKRLPTEAEWVYVASSAGKTKYPWGDTWADCGDATINFDPTADPPDECDFPVAVGTAGGQSADGVEDLGGSVFEWVWDATWTLAEHWPNGDGNYSGPEFGPDPPGQGHLRNGGAYFDKPEGERLKNDVFQGEFTDDKTFWDQGFRCVKTVR